MKAHSKLGASSMYRWSACPGSVRLCEGIESRTSSYAAEGTLAHEWAEKVLAKKCSLADVPSEMVESIQVYTSYCEKLMFKELGNQWAIETRFVLDDLYPGLFGTADFVCYDSRTKTLEVVDYKHGAGIPVEVLDNGKPNLQLVYYALGALLNTKYSTKLIKITVIQPRCLHPDGPIRSNTFDASYLLDFAADLFDAAVRTEKPDAPIIPGDHCRFCAAAPTCPAIHQKAVAIAKEEFRTDLSYDPKKLSDTLNMLPVLEAWCKNVREFAYQEAQHGRTPPGYKLVEKRAVRRWKFDDATTATSLGGMESLWEKKLKSPAQVEKLFGKKAIDSDLTIAESSGLALAPESDKRQEVSQSAAATFAKHDIEELI